MDPLRLLTRSTRTSKGSRAQTSDPIPSRGKATNPQLFGAGANRNPESNGGGAVGKKRKRGSKGTVQEDRNVRELDFFGGGSIRDEHNAASENEAEPGLKNSGTGAVLGAGDVRLGEDEPEPTEEERRQTLMRHKIKVTLLQHDEVQEEAPRKKKKQEKNKEKVSKDKRLLYPRPVTSFRHLRPRYGLSKAVADNIDQQGYSVPTEVQLSSLPLLLGGLHGLLDQDTIQDGHTSTGVDLLTVAPTGSGKTLAFMIPLIHHLQQTRRRNAQQEKDGTRAAEGSGPQAVILAPTKELSSQIVNEGRKLALNTGFKVTNVRKGMHLDPSKSESEEASEKSMPPVKSDILVSTPLAFIHAISGLTAEDASLANIRYLVLDEADVLLDPLFREQTLQTWNTLSRPDLRVSLWSATMGSNIEELAKETINQRKEKLSLSGRPITSVPLVRLVVGLKDSAVPNIHHELTYAATEQGKLMGLRQLLHPTAKSDNGAPTLRAPFLVFTQTIERAVALHSELLYDIPPEAGGISRVAVLHSGLSDTARDSVMTRLRKGEIWVLITTDLLSRGVDFRGINGVVNYDVPSSAAAYIHRVGRTGRAGREGGVAVTFYTKEDVPYIKNVANVIAASQKQRGPASEGQSVQQWLLDSLPTPSKRDKQLLKKRGVEARRSNSSKDAKDGRKTRISTKSGFERKVENNRKAAAAAQQARKAQEGGDSGSEDDFGGFDD